MTHHSKFNPYFLTTGNSKFSLSEQRAKKRQENMFTSPSETNTIYSYLKDNLESLVNLMCIVLVCGRKLEYPVIERIFKVHIQSPQAWNKTNNIFIFCFTSVQFLHLHDLTMYEAVPEMLCSNAGAEVSFL